MSISPWRQTDFTSLLIAAQKTAIDNAVKVLSNGLGSHFAVQAQSAPDMTVYINAGRVMSGSIDAGTLAVTTVAAQSTSAMTADGTNPRINLVYLTAATNVVGFIAGTPSASPAVPALTSGKIPLAIVTIPANATSITNTIIDDIRVPYWNGGNNTANQLENQNGIT